MSGWLGKIEWKYFAMKRQKIIRLKKINIRDGSCHFIFIEKRWFRDIWEYINLT